MLVQAEYYALAEPRAVDSDVGSNVKEQLAIEARQLVISALQEKGWITKHEINLSDSSNGEAIFNLDQVREFGSTELQDFIEFKTHSDNTSRDATIWRQEPDSSAGGISAAPFPGNSEFVTNQITEPETMLVHQLIAQPHHYDRIKPSLPPPERVLNLPDALVLRYIHPYMEQLYPRTHSDPYRKPVDEHSHYDEALNAFTRVWPRRTVTWLVPIAGKLPWHDTSEARIVPAETYSNPNSGPTQSPHSIPIVWTAELLQRFWEYLITHHGQSTFGPLTMSFIPSLPVRGERETQNMVRGIPVFRIRCHGLVAMKLRLALGTFTSKPQDQAKEEAKLQAREINKGAQEHVRWEDFIVAPLRRARLPLLDEEGTALLIA